MADSKFVTMGKRYRESLDSDAVMGYLAKSDLRTALTYSEGNFTPEKLIHPNLITPIFNSFYELSDFWSDLKSKITRYVTVFDDVKEPPIDTEFAKELFFLDINAYVNTNDEGKAGRLIVRTNPNANYTDAEKASLPRLEKGQEFRIIGSSGDYYQIEYLKADGSRAQGYVPKNKVGFKDGYEEKGDGTVGLIKSTTQEATPTPASTPTPEVETEPATDNSAVFKVATENDNLNVRQSPSGKVVGTLERGSEVKLTGVVNEADGKKWLEVDLGNGQKGYVAEGYIKNAAGETFSEHATNVAQQAATAQATETPTPTPTTTPTPEKGTVEPAVTPETSPASGTSTAEVKAGNADTSAYYASQKDSTHASQASSSSATTSPKPSTTTEASNASASSTDYYNKAREEQFGMKNSSSASTPTSPSTSPETTVKNVYVNTNTGRLNLRDASGKVIGTLDKGTAITPTGNRTSNGYIEVETPNGVGYVKDTYTSSVNPAAGTSEFTSGKTMTVNIQDQNSHLNFRTLPDTKSGQIIGRFDKGQELKVIDNNRSDGWVEVMTEDGTHGFVSGKYLK